MLSRNKLKVIPGQPADAPAPIRKGLGTRSRERAFAVLPTMMTLGNAFCGFAAITYAAKVGPETAGSTGGHLFWAAIYIFLAMFFDMLDGQVARWTHQTSDFGAQLDSLCDAVSFGVAPAFLMLQFSHEYHPRILWIIGVLYAVCAILRLARFNVESEEDQSHDYFSGLPTPAAAGVVASFPIAVWGLDRLHDPENPVVSRIVEFLGDTVKLAGHLLPPIVLALACLMVSRVRYPHFFNQLFKGRRSRIQLIRIVFAIAAVLLIRELALLLLFAFFAFGAPLRATFMKWIYPHFKATPPAPPTTPAGGEA
ncbi:CDP-diacylglycerol--serine O-phosphatidyltransferase [Planctomicrobium sp. SH664]|uniref:CDP-diacylglycerol--serine O-phosphatidyltransferase n=1 Tax=Planctomicrobium sp. SH664 TaxID=3448125 RepID=UPI003F5B3919